MPSPLESQYPALSIQERSETQLYTVSRPETSKPNLPDRGTATGVVSKIDTYGAVETAPTGSGGLKLDEKIGN